MEQKWAYTNSAAAPPSAAPPPSRPASAFGSRGPEPPASTSPSYNQDVEAFPLKHLTESQKSNLDGSSASALANSRSPSRNGFKADNEGKSSSNANLNFSQPSLERRSSAASAGSQVEVIGTGSGKKEEKERKRDSFDEWGNEDDEEQIGKGGC